jgi:hypothetical protein
MKPHSLRTLSEAVAYFQETFAAHPERDMLAALDRIRKGLRRRYPVLYIGHLGDPADRDPAPDEFELPRLDLPDTPEGQLGREVVNLLSPLKLDNPVQASLRLGRGTGTLAASFGIPLDPEADYAPRGQRPIADLLRDPEPDAETAGLMPEMRAKIELARSVLPPEIKIQLPDLQGPFNLLHAMAGDDAFLAPYGEPDAFREMMGRIVRLWLGARRVLLEWIGPDRLDPLYSDRICECSVNMISAEMYREFVLEHDQAIAREIGPIHLHHCSGPHVFRAVTAAVPVHSVEAGFIDRTAAGSASVEEVLAAIGDREINLFIGEELPRDFGAARETVQRHLDLYRTRPRISYGYTGMFWRKADRPAIRRLHGELDEYWTRTNAGS